MSRRTPQDPSQVDLFGRQPERTSKGVRARRRHRRRSWQEEVRAQAWQRAVVGSALVAVSGTLGLAGIRHPLTLPDWQAVPGPDAPQSQAARPAFAPLAVVAALDAAVSLDVPLSANARGATTGAGKVVPAEDGTGSSGRHVLTSQVLAAKQYAQSRLKDYGWTDPKEMANLDRLWTRESGWRVGATNPTSGAYGIPQSLPAGKLAAAGADWRTNARTQIDWGLSYIHDRYGSPSKAWAHSEDTGWY